MGSLVWKDLIVGKWFWAAGVFIYVGQLVAMSEVAPVYLLLTLVGTAFFAFVSVGIEEVQGTESLWISLPVSRAQVVGARYLTSLIGMAFGLGVSWIVVRTAPGWGGASATESAMRVGLGAYMGLTFVLLLSAAIFLPCYFRFGAGRGSQVSAGIWIGVLLLLSLVGSAVTFLAGGAEALAALRSPTPDQLAAAELWLDKWGTVLATALAAGALAVTAGSAALAVQFHRARD